MAITLSGRVRPQSTRASASGVVVKVSRKSRPTFAKKVERIIKSKAEKKFTDANLNSTTTFIDFNGAVYSLTDIAQGDTDTARNGDSVSPTSLRYSLTFQTNATPDPSVVRCIIFRWKPFYGSIVPTVGAILQYTGAAAAENSALVHDNRDQFTLLVDRKVIVNSLSGGQSQYQIEGMKKLSGQIQWKAGSTTDQANGLYMVLISNVNTNSPRVISYSIRTNYLDM